MKRVTIRCAGGRRGTHLAAKSSLAELFERFKKCRGVHDLLEGAHIQGAGDLTFQGRQDRLARLSAIQQQSDSHLGAPYFMVAGSCPWHKR